MVCTLRVVKIFFIIVTSFLLGTLLCKAEDYDYVDINNPFFKKIPIAIPHFKYLSNKRIAKKFSIEGSNLLRETLEFTGYFRMIDRRAFLIDKNNLEIVSPNINFKNWTTVGAELLLTGGVRVENKLLQVELRLYDTYRGQLLLGKKYIGDPIKDKRKIIRRFCSDVVYILTGDRGIFNSKIAFISTTKSAHKEIFVCDFDGYNPTQITRYKSITLSPAWSHDSQWLAFTSFVNGKPDLLIRNFNKNQGFIFDRDGTNISPEWVPGKFKLAASLSFSGDPEIYLLTKRGKIIKRLTNNMGIDVSPTWSPDGKKMAFVSKRSGSPQIYIKNIKTGKVERLTFNGFQNTQPSWCPKGEQIAYSGLSNGLHNIYLIDIENKEPIQLTYNTGDNESPSWSPDGSLIVFSSNREGSSKIYVMTSVGTDQRRLLSLPGIQSQPAWSSNIISN